GQLGRKARQHDSTTARQHERTKERRNDSTKERYWCVEWMGGRIREEENKRRRENENWEEGKMRKGEKWGVLSERNVLRNLATGNPGLGTRDPEPGTWDNKLLLLLLALSSKLYAIFNHPIIQSFILTGYSTYNSRINRKPWALS
ncbi:MAG: hypothetical protein ACOC59_03030, partial [Bacteroidota bacterium]